MQTIFEPFRIKSVEPLHFTTTAQRSRILNQAHYNPFLIHADDVLIDLLTDSGTSAMSSAQWAAMMQGDESYAGSASFYRFEKTIRGLTTMPYVMPTHQGRASEKILFTVLGGKDTCFLGNTFFDTTRANIVFSGGTAIDLMTETGQDPKAIAPFKGNIDLDALSRKIADIGAEHIPLCMITVTNNSGGGQPVSMQNIREAADICHTAGIPLYLDACRFAENCYFIKTREKGYKNKTLRQIAREMFSYADGCTMSAKKDAFANIGGFLALRDEKLLNACRNLLIITEGFPTYGGLAGRDLEAIAVGLDEVLQEDYLRYRIRSIEYLGDQLTRAGVPLVLPTGGHAIYLDARSFAPHIPPHQYPGQSLCAALYLEGGIRGAEIGSVMFGQYSAEGKLLSPPLELVRLAIPRRVYTQSHLDYVVEVIVRVFEKRGCLRGMKITYEAPYLRHFTAHFEPV